MHECNGVMIMYCVIVITIHLKNANKRTSGLYSNSNCCIGIGNTTNLTSTKEANTECITFHQMWHMRSGNWGPKLNNKGNEHMALEYAMVTWPWQWTMTSKSKVPKYWKNFVFWFIYKKYCILKQENCNPFSCQLLDLLPF